MKLRFFGVLVFVMIPRVALGQDAQINALQYPGPAWSPYGVGALIGVLCWLTFFVSNQPIGASGAYATIAGMLGRIFVREKTDSLTYFKENPPAWDWSFMLFIGIFIGAFFAAWSGGELTGHWLPAMWEVRFGSDSLLLRGIVAIVGGLLMAFGARLAGGCTSGHGISGTLQLGVGSWVSVVCFFVGGIIVAALIYRI